VHSSTHTHRPVRFTPCADAPVATNAADMAIALRTTLIALYLLGNQMSSICRVPSRDRRHPFIKAPSYFTASLSAKFAFALVNRTAR
jgi:hypothetical protein